MLIEVKDPAHQQLYDYVGHSHLFCIVSVRDLLTTSNQKHIIPLLSFCRTSRAIDESLTSLKQHHVSDIENLSESRTLAEKSSYHYSNIITCHRNTSKENKQTVGKACRRNGTEATVTIQVIVQTTCSFKYTIFNHYFINTCLIINLDFIYNSLLAVPLQTKSSCIKKRKYSILSR